MRLTLLLLLSACAAGPSPSLDASRDGAELSEEEWASCNEQFDDCVADEAAQRNWITASTVPVTTAQTATATRPTTSV